MGLDGELIATIRVRGVMAASMSARFRLKAPWASRLRFTVTGTPPQTFTTAARLGQWGPGMITSSPGSITAWIACMMAFMPPAVTAKRSGATSTPKWRAW